MMSYAIRFMNSPLGWLRVSATRRGVTDIFFITGNPPPDHGAWAPDAAPQKLAPEPPGDLLEEAVWPAAEILHEAMAQLRAYFDRRLTRFDLPLEFHGTPFQVQVWRALQEVPYGTTISYSELARRVGRPGAARPVGAANRANRLPIVVPCHRVITARGTLGGYAAGPEIKRALLALEGVTLR